MVKLGLVIGCEIPRPFARPRTKVVLPAPTSPTSSIIMDDSILPFSTRSRSPVVTGRASLKPLLVSRGRSRKVIFESSDTISLAKLAPKSSISCSE